MCKFSSVINFFSNDFRQEIKEEDPAEIIEEYLDEYYTEGLSSVAFIDPNAEADEAFCKVEPSVKIEELKSQVVVHQEVKYEPEPTFDGKWSSDEDDDDFDDNFQDSDDRTSTTKTKKTSKKSSDETSRKSFWSHKMRNLSGKIACKYCDTIFKSKEAQAEHSCKYLQCDPKNFICRICNKELSKKTFSNHLHETLDCQYCNKKFVNPRNMKAHIEKLHRGEKFIPPKKKSHDDYIKMKEAMEESTEIGVKKPKPQYPRKKERFECGKETPLLQ